MNFLTVNPLFTKKIRGNLLVFSFSQNLQINSANLFPTYLSEVSIRHRRINTVYLYIWSLFWELLNLFYGAYCWIHIALVLSYALRKMLNSKYKGRPVPIFFGISDLTLAILLDSTTRLHICWNWQTGFPGRMNSTTEFYN